MRGPSLKKFPRGVTCCAVAIMHAVRRTLALEGRRGGPVSSPRNPQSPRSPRVGRGKRAADILAATLVPEREQQPKQHRFNYKKHISTRPTYFSELFFGRKWSVSQSVLEKALQGLGGHP